MVTEIWTVLLGNWCYLTMVTEIHLYWNMWSKDCWWLDHLREFHSHFLQLVCCWPGEHQQLVCVSLIIHQIFPGLLHMAVVGFQVLQEWKNQCARIFWVCLHHICCFPIGQNKSHGHTQNHCRRGLPKGIYREGSICSIFLIYFSILYHIICTVWYMFMYPRS